MINEVLNELGAQVAVVDVVSVLPHVHAQQRCIAGGKRCSGRTHVDDAHRPIGFLHQPGSAGTEVAHGESLERLLEFVVATSLLVDGIGQRPG